MLECVVNISEGRRLDVVARIARAAGPALLDVHSDPHHHRSVLTLAGEEPARSVAAAAWAELDLRSHHGAHPRIGVVDVVPFVALDQQSRAEALAARNRFAQWAAEEMGVPCFWYGPERSLPELRRRAFTDLAPDGGPQHPHPSAGAVAVGARPVLVAYNLWLSRPDPGLARQLASAVRGPQVRALSLSVGERTQVSMNLLAPGTLGPAPVFDLVDGLARDAENPVASAELVGLLPEDALLATPRDRWSMLDLAADRTIEARLAAVGRAGAQGADREGETKNE